MKNQSDSMVLFWYKLFQVADFLLCLNAIEKPRDLHQASFIKALILSMGFALIS